MCHDAGRLYVRGLMAHTGCAALELARQGAVFFVHPAGTPARVRALRRVSGQTTIAAWSEACADCGCFRPLCLGVPFSVNLQARLQLCMSDVMTSMDAALPHDGASLSVRMVGVGGAPG